MSVASDYWDGYYTDNTYKNGKEPSPFLHQMLGRLHKGKALEIGMGEGQNAVYLAQKGFDVKGMDISKVAVERAKDLAQATGVSIVAEKADLDLYVMGIMKFDTILMCGFKPPITRYYTEIKSALKQGGTLLVDGFGTAEMTEPLGKEDAHKDIYFGTNELLKHLGGLVVHFYQESKVDGRHVVQALAQKPMDKDAAKYNLFGMSSSGAASKKDKHLEMAESLFKKKP